ncbi:fetuin-B [Tenrec ecaudatus]|uniref:fetuin-B n=1 Tax=Tenrec ecaudatus TaxID=94439 RepID=UPI003F59C78F
MGLFLPLVLCALAVCCGATSPPLIPQKPPLLFLRACNDSDVLAMADFALQGINKDRKEGYVLSLNQVSKAQEYREARPGSLYYLTLDVLDTSCHVLSKKPWKDCIVRQQHDREYGRCKAMFYANRPRRVLHLVAYNCTIRPVSRRKIHSLCPDCPIPTPTDVSNQQVREAAYESLQKYNNERPLKQFSLVQITRASSQWVFGPAYFVEYLITESPCLKDQMCILSIPDSPPVALCRGSLSRRGVEKFVSVNCDFFKPETPAPEDASMAVNEKPADLPKVEALQKEATTLPSPPPEAKPKGSVQYLPELDDEKPEQSQEKGPHEAFPVQLDLTTNPKGEDLDISFLFMGPVEEKLRVLPFPEGHHHNCLDPAQDPDPFILPS